MAWGVGTLLLEIKHVPLSSYGSCFQTQDQSGSRGIRLKFSKDRSATSGSLRRRKNILGSPINCSSLEALLMIGSL